LLDLSHNYLVSAVVTSAAHSALRVWNPNNGTCKYVINTHAITCFQHDENKIIAGSNGKLCMWNVKTGQHICDLLVDLTNIW